MSFKRSILLRYLFVGIVFPLFLQYVMYYRFTPNYQVGMLSEKGFVLGNNNGVFRYRILGAKLQLWVYEKIANTRLVKKVHEERNKIYDARLKVLDPEADLIFYFTYFLISTVCSILTAICILRIFDMKSFFEISDQQKILVTTLLTCFIGITQFVITHYDMLSYFFMAFCLVLFLMHIEKNNNIYLAVLCAAIVLATLNRESSLIILCFMATVYIQAYSLFKVRWIQKMILPALAYLIPYAALRFYLSGQKKVFQDITFSENFQFYRTKNIIAFSFFLFFLYLCNNLPNNRESRKLVWTFLLLATPYILIIFTVGLIIEVRLWMPLIMGITILAFMNIRSLKTALAE